jgi:uncharacterized membrane protein YeaQ/YmgE (transglycosylase-associated protein family)
LCSADVKNLPLPARGAGSKLTTFVAWPLLVPLVKRFESRRGTRMTLLEVFILLLVAGVCGAIGQAIVGVSRGGCLVAIAVGFVGAVIGIWLARLLALPELFTVDVGGTAFPLVWSVIGSALFVTVIHTTARPRW